MLKTHNYPVGSYAVIFTSILSQDTDDYHDFAVKMVELAKTQDGFLGMDSSRTNIGITISYWRDLVAIHNWRKNTEHLYVQKIGKERWYTSYSLMICRIERSYGKSNSL